MDNTQGALLLQQVRGFTIAHFRRLRERFPDIRTFVTAPPHAWRASGIPEPIVCDFARRQRTYDPQPVLSTCKRYNIAVRTYDDPEYPLLLKETHDPPIALFCQGNTSLFNSLCLAIVGSRVPTRYAAESMTRIAAPLPYGRLTIVSGLAVGVDALAHRTCLDHSGTTIAVLGSGIDTPSIYPSENRRLADDIIKTNGLLVTEYPPGTPPLKHHFPIRNRIIAGLSRAVLIVEAARRSGALITARIAIDENRDCCAIPGPVTNPNSEGTNELIRQGAYTICSTDGLLQILNIDPDNTTMHQQQLSFSEDEAAVMRCLSGESTHIDAIIETCALSPQATLATLAQLEMKGVVCDTGNRHYIISS